MPGVLEPRFGIGNAARRQRADQSSAFGSHQPAGSRSVDHANHLRRGQPERAPHGVMPDQAAVGIERPLHGRDRWVDRAAHRREVHGHRIRGVQRHQTIGDRGQVIGASLRQQEVPLGQPGPALIVADPHAVRFIPRPAPGRRTGRPGPRPDRARWRTADPRTRRRAPDETPIPRARSSAYSRSTSAGESQRVASVTRPLPLPCQSGSKDRITSSVSNMTRKPPSWTTRWPWSSGVGSGTSQPSAR